MIKPKSPINAVLFALAFVVSSAPWAETESERELNAATFSASESETQVQEEEAVEVKSGMGAIQGSGNETTATPDAGTDASGSAGAPK